MEKIRKNVKIMPETESTAVHNSCNRCQVACAQVAFAQASHTQVAFTQSARTLPTSARPSFTQASRTYHRALLLFAACVIAAVLAVGCSSQPAQSSAGEDSAAPTSADPAVAVEDRPVAQDGSAGNGQADPSAPESASSPAAAGEQPSSQDGAPSSAASSAAAAAPSATDLAWRDTDFALDPARTEWSFADNGRKVVYLTIDDGPSPRTPEVLDILDKYNCKATFFVVGADPSCYHYIKEAYDRGHTIGLHTFSHDYAQVYSSTDAYYADLDQIGQVVKDHIGYVPCFIRFPGGSSNGISANYSIGIMSSLVESVQAQGYQYYDWNVSFGDGAEHTTDELVGYVKEAPLETNIVLLCHDSEGKQTTVEALPQVIEYYQGLGYSFEAIDRSTWVAHHGVSN